MDTTQNNVISKSTIQREFFKLQVRIMSYLMGNTNRLRPDTSPEVLCQEGIK